MKEKSNYKIIILIILLAGYISAVLAANDPGHDVLYIEQQGDSELNGTLNVTDNLSVQDIIFSGVDLDVRGDGIQASGSNNQIIGTSNALSIQSLGNVFINTLTGTTSTVFLGDGSDSVNLNITGALYFKGNNSLATSAASEAAASNLYWGDKLLCDATQSNCGWATSSGTGDITSVQSDNTYIYNGSDSGQVYLLFNETKLNATIEERATAVGDGNNYTTGVSVTNASTHTITISRTGMSDLTTTFTDIDTDTNTGNCSLDQSCPLILYDTNATNFMTATTDNWINSTGDTATGNYTFDSGTLHIDSTNDRIGIGTASPNTTLHVAGGINVTSGNDICISGSNCLSNMPADEVGTLTNTYVCYTDGTNVLCDDAGMTFTTGTNLITAGNITVTQTLTGALTCTDCIDGTDLADTITLDANLSIDADTLFLDATNDRVGIGTATPEKRLDVRNTGGNSDIAVVSNNNGLSYVKLLEGADVEPLNDYGGMLKYDGATNHFFIGTIANGVENLSIYLARGNPNVGIGAYDPAALLHVNGTSNQMRVSYDDSNYGNISVNSGGNLTIKATGHVIIDLS